MRRARAVWNGWRWWWLTTVVARGAVHRRREGLGRGHAGRRAGMEVEARERAEEGGRSGRVSAAAPAVLSRWRRRGHRALRVCAPRRGRFVTVLPAMRVVVRWGRVWSPVCTGGRYGRSVDAVPARVVRVRFDRGHLPRGTTHAPLRGGRHRRRRRRSLHRAAATVPVLARWGGRR
jgi:hypothetical protein